MGNPLTRWEQLLDGNRVRSTQVKPDHRRQTKLGYPRNRGKRKILNAYREGWGVHVLPSPLCMHSLTVVIRLQREHIFPRGPEPAHSKRILLLHGRAAGRRLVEPAPTLCQDRF
jgi:hypothetical protein